MKGCRDSKQFQIGELVTSVFDVGTVYRVVENIAPTHGQTSTYLRLSLVKAGVDTFQYGVSDRKGRMADGRDYAPYHFKPATD